VDSFTGEKMLILNEVGEGKFYDVTTGQEKTLADLDGMPALVLSTCSNYSLVWWGSAMHGSCPSVRAYRPAPSDNTFYIIGDTAVYGSNEPTGTAVIVKAVNDPTGALIQPPVAANPFRQVWNDSGSGGSQDGSIWVGVAPDGFVAIGAVANAGYNPPSISNYGCINVSLLTQVSQGLSYIWSDKGSHAHGDVEFWSVPGLPNAFVTSNVYDTPPPNGAYKFRDSQ
jgi:hypothetical protein